MTGKEPFVAVLMGSDSDLPIMRGALAVLDELGLPWECRVTSAHRTPTATAAYVAEAEQRGCAVFIAAAGLAAHLAGAVAAQTVRPVIGVPMEAGPLRGEDALLSTVMMPAGIPVASVAIGSAGARNAAFLAGQILGLQQPEVAERLRQIRIEAARKIEQKNALLQASLAGESSGEGSAGQ